MYVLRKFATFNAVLLPYCIYYGILYNQEYRNTEQRNTEYPRNNRTPLEHRNTIHLPNDGTTPEHGTPAERRNNAGITEHHRYNGTPLERWKTAEWKSGALR